MQGFPLFVLYNCTYKDSIMKTSLTLNEHCTRAISKIRQRKNDTVHKGHLDEQVGTDHAGTEAVLEVLSAQELIPLLSQSPSEVLWERG